MKEAFVGFDSAWSVNNKGAICYAIRLEGVVTDVCLPHPSSFDDAAKLVNKLLAECDDVLVAIDQPIIVPKYTGSRRVETVSRSLMSPTRLRSGVQSANRNKTSMFGDDAPVWAFVSEIGSCTYSGKAGEAAQNPLMWVEAAKVAAEQTIHLIEVFPALALPALEPHFMERKCAARYNPQRATFRPDDWRRVCETVERHTKKINLGPLATWAREMADRWGSPQKPKKIHQDQIDAAICLIIALQWREQIEGVCVIGDLDMGYMVTPTYDKTRAILRAACQKRKVCFSVGCKTDVQSSSLV